MSSPIKTLVDSIMSSSHAAGTNAGSSVVRNTAPYYQYGSVQFGTVVSRPPQIRIKATAGTTTKSEKLPAYQVTGSLLTMNQDLEFNIWGADEEECFRELSYFAVGYLKMNGTTNAQGFPQPTLFENLTYNWVDIEGHSTCGNMLQGTFKLKLHLFEPGAYRQHVLVNSASMDMSMSMNPNITSSYTFTETSE